MSVVIFTAASEAELQPKSNLVHYSPKIFRSGGNAFNHFAESQIFIVALDIALDRV